MITNFDLEKETANIKEESLKGTRTYGRPATLTKSFYLHFGDIKLVTVPYINYGAWAVRVRYYLDGRVINKNLLKQKIQLYNRGRYAAMD